MVLAEFGRMKSVRAKLLLRLSILFILLFVLIQVIVVYHFRNMSLENSEDKAYTAAELIRDTITSYMVMGVIDKRDLFLEKIKQTHGIKSIRVIRGRAVVEQFGPGKSSEQILDPQEEKVIRTGQEHTRKKESLREVEYTLIIPYKATTKGRPNCLSCHKAMEGDVLGAVSITMDLTEIRQASALTIVYVSLISFLIFIMTLIFVIRFFKPYTDMFKRMGVVLSRAEEGDFSEVVKTDLNDEAGAVAENLNRTIHRLSLTLTSISRKVSHLIGYGAQESGNAIKDTSSMVDQLVNIYNFKRIIENDRKKSEIYSRITQMLLHGMKIHKFTIYEIDSIKGNIVKIDEGGEGPWCREEIFTNADECRAKRTGHLVNSKEFPSICQNFACLEKASENEIMYQCIPSYIGGSVGNILQIVYTPEDNLRIKPLIPYINSYMQEAAPVIESRIYMDLLKDQSVNDSLSGLYNRRFLDEIAPKITAQILRKKTILGVLLIDIDNFKNVNDKYGHDAGDQVIIEISAVIKNAVRESDVVIRFGGEEILVLLMDIQENKSLEVAEKIRKNVEMKSIEISTGLLHKTVSVGIADFPRDSEKFWDVVKFADLALYRAKGEGRNKIVHYTSDMWNEKEFTL